MVLATASTETILPDTVWPAIAAGLETWAVDFWVVAAGWDCILAEEAGAAGAGVAAGVVCAGLLLSAAWANAIPTKARQATKADANKVEAARSSQLRARS